MCSDFYDMPSHHGYNRVFIVTFSVDNYFVYIQFGSCMVGILLHMYAHNKIPNLNLYIASGYNNSAYRSMVLNYK